ADVHLLPGFLVGYIDGPRVAGMLPLPQLGTAQTAEQMVMAFLIDDPDPERRINSITIQRAGGLWPGAQAGARERKDDRQDQADDPHNPEGPGHNHATASSTVRRTREFR